MNIKVMRFIIKMIIINKIINLIVVQFNVYILHI